MSLLEKLKKKKAKMQKRIDKRMDKGREATEQMKADKLRKDKEKAKYLEPGTIRYGLHYRQNPMDFTKDAHECRKQKRNR